MVYDLILPELISLSCVCSFACNTSCLICCFYTGFSLECIFHLFFCLFCSPFHIFLNFINAPSYVINKF